MTDKARRRADALLFFVAGIATLLAMAVDQLVEGSAKILLLIALDVVIIAIWTAHARRPDVDRIATIVPIVVAISSALAIARETAETKPEGIQLLVAGLIVVLFILPMPAFFFFLRRRQDELERSLLATSASIGMVALVLALLGYHVIDEIVGLPEVPMAIVAVAALAMWAISWGAMRFAFR